MKFKRILEISENKIHIACLFKENDIYYKRYETFIVIFYKEAKSNRFHRYSLIITKAERNLRLFLLAIM